MLRLAFASVAPGLLLLALLRVRAGDREGGWAALALALSPVLLAGATALLSFGIGRSLSGATRIVSWGTCAALVAVAALGPARGKPAPRPNARTLALGLAPTAALVGLACVVLLPPGTRLSYHGLVHAGFAAQIASGVLPPENPAMAGEALHYYWLYHWLLAVLHELGGFSILVNAPLTNGVALAVYVAAGHQLLRRFLDPVPAALGALAVGFAMNLLLPVLVLARAAAGDLPPSWFYFPFDLLGFGLIGGDPRLVTLFAKFLNLSGFALGLALWAALLVELLPQQDSRARPLLVFALLCGTLLFHSAAAMAAYAGLGLACLSVSVPRFRGTPPLQLLRANLPTAAVFLLALAATSPYLVATLYAPGSLAGPAASWPAALRYNAAGVAFSATPIALAVPLALWRLRDDPSSRFLAVASGVPLALGLLLNVPDGNQYKLVQLASLPGGVLLFRLLSSSSRRTARLGFAVAVTLALLSHAVTAAAYLRSGMSHRSTFAGDGAYLTLAGEPEVDAALRWLRVNTPADAVVVARPQKRGRSPIAAVSGRGDFVLEALPHFQGPGYGERLQLARTLFSVEAPAGPSLRRISELLDRPLYVLLLRSGDPDPFEALREKFERAPEALEELYRSGEASVYHVKVRRVHS